MRALFPIPSGRDKQWTIEDDAGHQVLATSRTASEAASAFFRAHPKAKTCRVKAGAGHWLPFRRATGEAA